MGRPDLQKEFTNLLSDFTSAPKRIFIISGLEGIGRRSYLERISKDTLGLNMGPFFAIDDTTGLDDLYLWALNETGDLGTRSNLAEEIKSFEKLNQQEKVSEIVARLRILCSDNCIPCMIDQGGMLVY